MTRDARADGTRESERERSEAAAADATRRSFLKSTSVVAAVGAIGVGASATATAQSGEMNAVAFDFSTLPTLSQGHYEGWAIFGEEKVSTGTFSIGDEYVFEVDRDLSMADALVVTIEPAGDEDPAPSGVPILKGAVDGTTVDLSFPVHFDQASGSYILATPTNGSGTHETSGIWFLDPAGDGPSASLDLPDLPAGWTYEGWVVHEGRPLSTGRFDDPSMADDAMPYSAQSMAPPFPGEDFLRNAPGDLSFPTDLTDGSSKAVISLEPDMDGMDPTGEAPFAIKPLVGQIPGDGTDHTSYELQHNEGTVPSGTATPEWDVGGSDADPTDGLVLEAEDLPALSEGKYQVWLVFEDGAGGGPDGKHALGAFSGGGTYQFETYADLQSVAKVVVTIEPEGDVGYEPSGVPVLAGALDGESELTFPTSFEDPSGSYILATPTNGSGSNETSGIWFLDPAGDGPSASLDLPAAPDGWTYEGWVVHEGVPLSTGRFDDPSMADDAMPYSAMAQSPPFPGEDFLRNAPGDLSFPTDLTDGSSKAVISVEPDMDGMDPTGEAPFAIKPLAGQIPGDGTDHTSYDLSRTGQSLPAGTGTLYEDAAAARGEDDATTLTFEFSTLPTLSQGHYEGWVIFGDEKVSTGTFAAGDEHVVEVDRDLSTADAVVVTIEPDDDQDPAPSGIPILKGSLADGSASLSFPASFGDAAGSYILATPTNGSGTHETSGVWFLDPAGDGPSASLDLPDLPAGWTYEGWVVHEGTPISTGRFDDPAMADDAAPYSGDGNAPPFPGEDLLRNAPGDLSFPTDLTDGSSKVVISVEPDMDGTDPTGETPFAIKPLAGQIPADGTDHTSYDLAQTGAALPSGTATVGAKADLPVIGDSEHPPKDPDDDGLYEDVNGNGRLDLDDSTTLYQQRDSDAVLEHAEKFDFNGSGEIEIGDAVKLFRET